MSGLGQCSWYIDCYMLYSPAIESQWRVRFSAPVQTSPGSHPASYTMVNGSISSVKWLERGIDHPLPPSAEVQGGVELHLYFPSGPWLFSSSGKITVFNIPLISSKQILACKDELNSWRLLHILKTLLWTAANFNCSNRKLQRFVHCELEMSARKKKWMVPTILKIVPQTIYLHHADT